MALFVKDEEVIGHGVIYLHLIAVMYILPAVTNAIQGFFRGIGDLKVTLMSSFTNMAVRVIAAAPMILLWNFGIEALPYSSVKYGIITSNTGFETFVVAALSAYTNLFSIEFPFLFMR